MPLTNEQYDAIMREYEHTRSLNRKEADRRKREIYEKIPAYEKLDLSIPDLGLAFASDLFKKNASSVQDLHQKMTAVSAEKKALLVQHGYPEDYLEPLFSCKDCRDTGIENGRRCLCYQEKVKQLHFVESHLSELIRTNNFDLMKEYHVREDDRTHFQYAVDTCKKFISSFGRENASSGILFYGPVGTGKTFLTLAVAKEILDKGFSVLYFSAAAFFERTASVSFHSNDTAYKNAFFEEIYACDLLIIDDLGTELDGKNIYPQLFNCINERYLRHTATLISTNLDLEKLYTRYTDRIFSRLVAQLTPCELTGEDVRILKTREKIAGKT